MKLKFIISLGFIVIAISIGVTGFIIYNSVNEIENSFNEAVKDAYPVVTSMLLVDSSFKVMQKEILFYVVKGDEEYNQEFEEALIDYQKYKDDIIEREKHEGAGKWTELFVALEISERRMVTMFNEVSQLKDSSALNGTDLAELRQIRELEEFEHGLDTILGERIESEQRELKEQEENVLKTKKQAIDTILILIIFEVILAIGLGLFTSRFISKPLDKLSHSVDEVSRGNFDVQIKMVSKINEINNLADSLNRVLVSMKLAVLRVGIKKAEMGIQTEQAKEEPEESPENFVRKKKKQRK